MYSYKGCERQGCERQKNRKIQAAKKRNRTTLPAENPIPEGRVVDGIVQNPWRITQIKHRSGFGAAKNRKEKGATTPEKAKEPTESENGVRIDERV